MTRLRTAGLFFLLAFLFLGRSWAGGKTHYPADILASYPLYYDGVGSVHNPDLFDVLNIFYPQSVLFHKALDAGRLAAWDPYSFGGHNLISNGHSGFFYPLRWATHLVAPMPWAHDLYLWIHLGLAGTFFCLLLEGFGLDRRAAILGGAVYQFNGFGMGFLEHEHVITYLAWIPLALHLYHQGSLQHSPPRRKVLWLSAAFPLGMAGLVGMMQFWAYTLIFCSLWGLSVWWSTRPRALTDLVALVFSWLFAIGLGAINVLPIFADLGDSARAVIPWQYQSACVREVIVSLPLALVLPDYAGNPVGNFHLQRVTVGGNWIYPETSFYLGILPLVLASLSWSRRARLEWRFFALFPLGLALLSATPLFAVIHALVPGFKQTIVTRFFFVLPLCFSALAAQGLDCLLDGSALYQTLRNRLAALLALLVGLYWVAAQSKTPLFAAWFKSGRIRLPDPSVTPDFPVAAQRAFDSFFTLGNPTFWGPLALLSVTLLALTRKQWKSSLPALLIGLSIIELGARGWAFNSANPPQSLYPSTAETRFLQQHGGRALSLGTVRPNTLAVYGVQGLEGDESLYPEWTRLYGSALAQRPWHGPESFNEKLFPIRALQQSLVDAAAIRWLIVHPAAAAPPPWKEVLSAQLRLYQNPSPWPECYWTGQARSEPTTERAIQLLAQSTGPQDPVVLAEPPKLGQNSSAEWREMNFERHQPEHIVVRGPIEAGWVVLAEGYNRGWTVSQDGRSLPVVRANGMFMAAQTQQGGDLEWRFEPPGLALGAKLTLVSLALLVALLGMLGWTARKPEKSSPGLP